MDILFLHVNISFDNLFLDNSLQGDLILHDILLEELSLIFGFPTYAVPKISALFCNLTDIHVIKEDTKSNEDNQEQDVLPVTHFRANK